MTISGKNTAAAALVALFAAGCAHGPTPAELKMQADLTEIKAKLDKIEKKLNAPIPTNSAQTAFRGNRADPAVLAKIVLPPNPTKAQITDYINKILTASKNQNSFSNQDIQVEMLAKVGEDNLDLLIAALPRDSHKFHTIYTIKQLASAKSKAAILKYLDRYPDLVDAVVINGWEKDAREILLAKLNTRPQYLPTNWIQAVKNLKDPKAYPGMIEYFIYGTNKSFTYEQIKNLSGINLNGAVADAWDMARMDQDWGKFSMAIIAVRYGHLDALETLIDNQKNQNQYLRGNIRQAILNNSDASGSAEEITRWFQKNKADLVFDPITRKFKVKAGNNQPETAKEKRP